MNKREYDFFVLHELELYMNATQAIQVYDRTEVKSSVKFLAHPLKWIMPRTTLVFPRTKCPTGIGQMSSRPSAPTGTQIQ
jgi:hypothetical protein